MKLYLSPRAPSPRRVTIFLAEKGVTDMEQVTVSIAQNEHQSAAYRAKSPLAKVPALELDDGTTISETVAICRYFEETQPEPSLFGKTAFEKAVVDMWVRRVEFMIMTPVGMFWRHAHPYTAALLTQHKDFGESNRETVAGGMRWMDRELEGKAFVAGDAYSMADICLLSTIDFATWIGLDVPEDCANLKAWHERVTARPSAAA